MGGVPAPGVQGPIVPPRHHPAPLPPPHHISNLIQGINLSENYKLDNQYALLFIIIVIADNQPNVGTMKAGGGRCAPESPSIPANTNNNLVSPTPAPGGPNTHLADLTHLAGPLTEDAVIKCLQAKFYANKFYVSIIHIYI